MTNSVLTYTQMQVKRKKRKKKHHGILLRYRGNIQAAPISFVSYPNEMYSKPVCCMDDEWHVVAECLKQLPLVLAGHKRESRSCHVVVLGRTREG